MSLPELSIRRPVLAGVLSLLLIALGVGAVFRLPVREYPQLDPPIVSVSATYRGASAAVVERDVTEVIEENLNGIDGVEQIVSTTRDGLSQIDVEFEVGRDLDAAAADVRDRVGAVGADLPDDIDQPVIAKTSADEDAMTWITLASDARGPLALTDFADRNLVDVLGVVPGVARVQIGGEERYAMRVWLDPAALAARELTVPDVTRALASENVELPAGELRTSGTVQTVRTGTRFASVQDFERPVLQDGPGGQVLLGDVARIEVGAEEDQRALLASGRPAIGLGIIRQSGSNVLSVADAVRAELDRLAPLIPDDIRVNVPFDESVFVRGSVREAVRTLAITSALVVAVVFLFLGSLRGTLVPAVTIPLALVLAIGLVVDDSIVVLENVTRHREEGQPGLLAAVNATREVGLAVVATTLVLGSVFVPLAFLTGATGRLFAEFAVTLAAAVLFSSFVALTLGAALAGRLARTKEEAGTGWLARGIDRAFGFLERGYAGVLGRAIDGLAADAGDRPPGRGRHLARPARPAAGARPHRGPRRPHHPGRAARRQQLRADAGRRRGDRRAARPLPGRRRPRPGVGRDRGPRPRGTAAGERGARDREPQAVGRAGGGVGRAGQRAAAEAPRDHRRPCDRDQPAELGAGRRFQPAGPVRPERPRLRDGQRLGGDRARPGGGGRPSGQREPGPRRGQPAAPPGDRPAARRGPRGRRPRGRRDAAGVPGGRRRHRVRRPRRDLRGDHPGEPAARQRPEDLGGVYVRSGTTGALISLGSLATTEDIGTARERQRVDRLPSVVLSGVPAPGLDLGRVLGRLEEIVPEELPPEARVNYLDLLRSSGTPRPVWRSPSRWPW